MSDKYYAALVYGWEFKGSIKDIFDALGLRPEDCKYNKLLRKLRAGDVTRLDQLSPEEMNIYKDLVNHDEEESDNYNLQMLLKEVKEYLRNEHKMFYDCENELLKDTLDEETRLHVLKNGDVFYLSYDSEWAISVRPNSESRMYIDAYPAERRLIEELLGRYNNPDIMAILCEYED